MLGGYGSSLGFGSAVVSFAYGFFYYVFIFGLVLLAAMLIKEGNKDKVRKYIFAAVIIGLLGMLLTTPGIVSGVLR